MNNRLPRSADICTVLEMCFELCVDDSLDLESGVIFQFLKYCVICFIIYLFCNSNCIVTLCYDRIAGQKFAEVRHSDSELEDISSLTKSEANKEVNL